MFSPKNRSLIFGGDVRRTEGAKFAPAHSSASVTANRATPSAFGIYLCLSFTFQRKLNCLDDAVDVVHDLVVPKSDDFIAQRFKIFCALCVVFDLFQMLTSIQFDDEFLFDADEIGDEVANGVLTAEVDTEFVVADVCPQFTLGGCGVFAQFSRCSVAFWRGSSCGHVLILLRHN